MPCITPHKLTRSTHSHASSGGIDTQNRALGVDNRCCINSLEEVCQFPLFHRADMGYIGLEFLTSCFPNAFVIANHHDFVSASEKLLDIDVEALINVQASEPRRFEQPPPAQWIPHHQL